MSLIKSLFDGIGTGSGVAWPLFGIVSSALSFVGVFGSVAGSSSGIFGLISACGLISGFSAIPLLGAMILILAVVIGAYAAVLAIQTSIEKNTKEQVYKTLKIYNQDFVEQFFVRKRWSYNIQSEEKRFNVHREFYLSSDEVLSDNQEQEENEGYQKNN